MSMCLLNINTLTDHVYAIIYLTPGCGIIGGVVNVIQWTEQYTAK